MIPALCERAVASPRRRWAALFAGIVLSAVLAAGPGALAPAAGRAGIATAVLAAAVAVARARGSSAPGTRVDVLARATVAGGAGVALLAVGGKRLLVGFGKGGVRLVADLGVHPGEGGRP